MTFEIDWMFCVLLLLTGSSQTLGESSAGPLVLTSTGPLSHVGTSATPNLREKHPGHEAPQQKHNPAGRNESSAEATDITESKGAGPAETATDAVFKANTQHVNVSVFTTAHAATGSPSAAAHSLSSTPPAQSTTSLLQRVSAAEGRPLLTREPLATFSSQPTHTDHDASPTALASTSQQQSGSVTTATTRTSALGRGPAGPTHQEIPSELNIGDEDLKGPGHRLSSPLDPLLAGLLSIFIVTTAIVFVALFLKFRQRANHPEFHRLQDLPMDDLMEDTPLSRYTY